MSHPAVSLQPLSRTASALSARSAYLVVVAAALLAAALYVQNPVFAIVLLSSGVTLAALFVLIKALAARGKSKVLALGNQISAIICNDGSPCFVTDEDGAISYQNDAASDRFQLGADQTLAHTFRDNFANPAAIFFRLQSKAQAVGMAREDVVTRRGHTRVSVNRIGENLFLWRIDEFGERAASGRGAEGISLPMLTASKSGTVLFMNEAMRKVLGGRAKSLDRVFNELPLRPGFENEVASKDGPLNSLVAEIEGAGGRREIYLVPGLALASSQTNAVIPVFDQLPVPLLKIAPGGVVKEANKMARNLLSDPIVPETPVSDLIEGLGRSVRDWLDDAFQGRGAQRSEVIRARKPEKEVFLQITLTQFVQDEEPLLIAVLTDATELKTLEAQFVQSQKMQAIGQLAGGVAHDFNNLLTAITGHCDLLMLRYDQGDPEYGDLMQINQNANRAASLVGQLLAFSRKQNLQPEVIDLRDTLSDLTHLLNRLVGEKVTLTLSHDPGLLPIRVDKRQLEQVLMNLVVNARDAMPSGGQIRLETQARTLHTPLHRDRAEVPAGDYVTVQVFDQGHGIAPDKLAKIFEPFYTTKRTGEGTGLGLSMAYGIVKQTGGFIFVDSVVGAGTTFTLYFPVFDKGVSPEMVSAESVVDAPASAKGEGVVLLVEDEAPVRAFASRALRMRGYTVLEADCAEEALKTLEDGSLNVDLFVTDVIMPGMDGPSWVREALKERPEVKVVFVSGYAEDAFGDSQDAIPNSVFLPKPFSLSDLTSTVQQQLH